MFVKAATHTFNGLRVVVDLEHGTFCLKCDDIDCRGFGPDKVDSEMPVPQQRGNVIPSGQEFTMAHAPSI